MVEMGPGAARQVIAGRAVARPASLREQLFRPGGRGFRGRPNGAAACIGGRLPSLPFNW